MKSPTSHPRCDGENCVKYANKKHTKGQEIREKISILLLRRTGNNIKT